MITHCADYTEVQSNSTFVFVNVCVQSRTGVSPTPALMEVCAGVTDGITCACAKTASLGTSARCVSGFALPHKSVSLTL